MSTATRLFSTLERSFASTLLTISCALPMSSWHLRTALLHEEARPPRTAAATSARFSRTRTAYPGATSDPKALRRDTLWVREPAYRVEKSYSRRDREDDRSRRR